MDFKLADAPPAKLPVSEELHICPGCRYDGGFHVSFIRKESTDSLQLILICPDCGLRYDIDKQI